jgi:hypothetical protein
VESVEAIDQSLPLILPACALGVTSFRFIQIAGGVLLLRDENLVGVSLLLFVSVVVVVSMPFTSFESLAHCLISQRPAC